MRRIVTKFQCQFLVSPNKNILDLENRENLIFDFTIRENIAYEVMDIFVIIIHYIWL